jgi:hypothetical protein
MFETVARELSNSDVQNASPGAANKYPTPVFLRGYRLVRNPSFLGHLTSNGC